MNKKTLNRLKRQGRVRTVRGPSLRLPHEWRFPVPPSVNAIWHTVKDHRTGRNKRVLTAKARDYRKMVKNTVRGTIGDEPTRLSLHMTFALDAFTQKGTIRKVDLTNRIKFLEDCLCEALGYDDSRHWRVTLEKLDVPAPDAHVTVRIDEYP